MWGKLKILKKERHRPNCGSVGRKVFGNVSPEFAWMVIEKSWSQVSGPLAQHTWSGGERCDPRSGVAGSIYIQETSLAMGISRYRMENSSE